MPLRPPIFRPRGQRTRQEANVEYDQRRGSARERGYGARWDKASIGFRRENPLCLGCQAVGRVVACEVTDHVVPHKGDMKLFWNRGNWQPACEWHHSVIKQRLEVLYARGVIGTDQLWLNSKTSIQLSSRS